VLVDDDGWGCVSTAGYICHPPKRDVRGIANADMFTRIGGNSEHRVFRRRREFSASITRKFGLVYSPV